MFILSRLSLTARPAGRRWLVPALALAGVGLTALCAAPAANAQANLTFSGGSGSPLSLTLVNPVTYTVTVTNNIAPLFIFQNVGNPFSGSTGVSGDITFRVNGGATQTIVGIGSGNTFGAVAANDIYIYGNLPGVTVGDIVTLASGTVTSTISTTPARPTNGSYNTFLSEIVSGTRLSANSVSGSANAPEPGSLALLAPFAVGGVAVLRRKRAA